MCVRTKLSLTIAVFCLATATPALAQPGGRGFGGRGFGGPGFDSDGPSEAMEPEEVPFELGVATIPDRETFEKLSYQGPMRGDTYLSDLEFVKFVVVKAATDDARIYWMNTETTQMHPHFMGRIGLGGRGGRGGRGRGGFGGGGGQAGGATMRGALTYLPRLKSPNGTAGLYIFDFQPNDRFAINELKSAQDLIIETMPFAKGKVAYHAFRASEYASQREAFEEAKIVVHLDQDIYGDIAYLPLNEAESFGYLRFLDNDTRPSPRDIVICKTLPNQLPRVAGVISEVRQTPLSHVNLRAIQDKVPNAFVANASKSPDISSLIGKLVSYKVTSQGYKLREAAKAEVDEHFASIRPKESPSLERNLRQREILPLAQVKFTDSSSFGVKAANLATMHTFGFPEGTIPDGVAVPFYFYDEFMKHNDFYELIGKETRSEEFKTDRESKQRTLKRIRSLIEKGQMPEWMMAALERAHKSFPGGTSLRCRSSTNNEDLPGFSGAGLYDSCTHRPDEGHLSNSIKQVYASLWNYRAFEEREFYRIDHMLTAMGVLLHPNFSEEKANGVAVTDDILYETQGNYYLNTQIGEDLVTNPNAESSPEEVLLGWWERDGHDVVRKAANGERLLSDEHLAELRERLARVHARFRDLYGKTDQDQFAMEIEFKISKDGKLAIKQARPWVF